MSIESMAHVLRNSCAKGTTKLVLLGIANHDGDGGAWPSIATLATYANASERTVQRCIRELEDMGEVIVHEQDGGTRATREDRRPNRYTITVSARVNGVTPMSPRGGDGVTSVVGRGDTRDANGVTQVSPEPSLNHPEPSITPSPRPAATQTAPDAALLADAFEAFWAAYPRRVGKQAARKAFDKAVARIAKETKATVDLGVIVNGARRMAADPNLPEAGFIPHPTTWLNQGRWEDAPYPPRADRRPTTDDRVRDGLDLAARLAAQEAQGTVIAIGGRL